MAKIFFCYRRNDSAGWTGRIYDRVAAEFGSDDVFIDVDTLEPGQDFSAEIRKSIAACDFLIAVIGPEWMTVTDADGNRRLDDPNDFIRLEIASAFQTGVKVIPVLVGGATVPGREELPEDLEKLPERHALEISDSRFSADVSQLIRSIDPRRQRIRRLKKVILAGVAVVAAIALASTWSPSNRAGSPSPSGEHTGEVIDLSGEWSGDYWYHGQEARKIPFTAKIEQDGRTFTGLITEQACSAAATSRTSNARSGSRRATSIRTVASPSSSSTPARAAPSTAWSTPRFTARTARASTVPGSLPPGTSPVRSRSIAGSTHMMCRCGIAHKTDWWNLIGATWREGRDSAVGPADRKRQQPRQVCPAR